MEQRIKLLVVDDDPQIFALIQQILKSSAYELLFAQSASEGLKQVVAQKPDLILLDLAMPQAGGNDFLAKIKPQNYPGSIIVLTEAGQEAEVLSAFRLGASDFLSKPLHPPDLLASLEGVMEEVKYYKTQAQLLVRLQTTNMNLQEKVKELTLLSNLGQVLAGLRNLEQLFEVVLSSLVDMTGADYSAIMLKNGSQDLTLTAGKNLNLAMQDQLGEKLKDELAEYVMLSHEPMIVDGDKLQSYKLPRDIRAVVYVSLISEGKAIGVLCVGNYKKRDSFSQTQARLIRTLADYAALGLTNAHLLSSLNERLQASESALKSKDEERQQVLQNLKTTIYQPLVEVDRQMTQLQQAALPPQIKQNVETMQEQTRRVLFAIQEAANPPRPTKGIYRISST